MPLNTYRKIQTSRGIYYVAWEPVSVQALLLNEGIKPSDCVVASIKEIKAFIRDLFLLACLQSLDDKKPPCLKFSLLASFAHELNAIQKRGEVEQTG